MSRFFTGESRIELKNKVPTAENLLQKFEDIKTVGIYLHIPFCEQICPYCPYNKEIYRPDTARQYAVAVKKEIDFYAGIIGRKPVTSFYIGGGTPTTMLHTGLVDIIEHLYDRLNMQCHIHLESHPNHLSSDNLDFIQSLGVRYLSIGVESLQDKHLHTLKRPYTTKKVINIVERVVAKNFDCVNLDFIFALPEQTFDEVECAGKTLVDMGVNQVAAYPLFRFPYTKMGGDGLENAIKLSTIRKRKKMLAILENIFYGAGFERSSVWAFTEIGVEKYCSVTVPLYIGLGASGGTYLKDIFYLNTFNATEYIKAFENGGTAWALSLDLPEKMQMAGWLYWRIYETRFHKKDFKKRFGVEFDHVYGRLFQPLRLFGFFKEDNGEIVLSDKGTFWLHAFEDFFSIDYISTLWGTSKQQPWPERVVL